MTTITRRATLSDLDALVPLFDAYRVFYSQPSNAELAHDFLEMRLQRAESVVLLCAIDGVTAGFVQLYPTFSSVRAARVWILNDLFVAPDARRRGVAGALLRAAADFGRANGALRLELETGRDNVAAQALYRNEGWTTDQDTLRFHLPLVA